MNKRREFAIFLFLALVGAAVFGWFFPSFPTATVPVEHSEGESRAIATAFLEEQGYDVSAYHPNTSFFIADGTSTYIQRTLPWREARTAILDYDVYAWETTFSSPLQSDEFYVDVDPTDGEVIYFYHYIPDDAPGSNLSHEAARQRAEAFLAAQGHDLSRYELVEDSVTNLPNRRDHTFVWRHTERSIGAAPYYVEVDVQGERIGYYEPYLHVPDGFYDSFYDRQLQGQFLLGAAFLGASVLLTLAAVVYGLRYYKRNTFDARFALIVGGLVAVLSVVDTVNSLPSVLQSLPSEIPTTVWISAIVVGAVVGALVFGGITAIFAGAGKRLSREVLDYEVVGRIASLRTDADLRRRTAVSLVRGFLLAWILLGFYTLFYMIGTASFDVWLPADTPVVMAVTTYLPAVVALTVGGVAALSEEVIYRLFAIPLGKRYLKFTPLAVVVPAIVWGLGHSGYVVLPVYARVVEVTLVGVILGVVFLRYGLLTTVVAHFSLNALAVGVPILLARTTRKLLIHGALSVLIALLPLLAAAVLIAYDSGSGSRREPIVDDSR